MEKIYKKIKVGDVISEVSDGIEWVGRVTKIEYDTDFHIYVIRKKKLDRSIPKHKYDGYINKGHTYILSAADPNGEITILNKSLWKVLYG